MRDRRSDDCPHHHLPQGLVVAGAPWKRRTFSAAEDYSPRHWPTASSACAAYITLGPAPI